MAKNYTIEMVDSIAVIRYTQATGIDDIAASIDDAAANYQHELRLWDLRQLILKFSFQELMNFATQSKYRFKANTKVAFLVPTEYEFDLIHMYGIYIAKKEVEHQVFYSEEEARNWLLNESDTRGPSSK